MHFARDFEIHGLFSFFSVKISIDLILSEKYLPVR